MVPHCCDWRACPAARSCSAGWPVGSAARSAASPACWQPISAAWPGRSAPWPIRSDRARARPSSRPYQQIPTHPQIEGENPALATKTLGKDEILDAISNMTVLELSELVKAVE